MEPITQEEVNAFMRSQYIMQIATSDKLCNPQVSVLLFALANDSQELYFATHKSSTKAQNLLENPTMDVVIWEHHNMLVQMNGGAQEVTDESEAADALEKLSEQAAKEPDFWPPVLRIKGSDYAIFKFTPEKVTALNIASKNMREKTSPFTSIK